MRFSVLLDPRVARQLGKMDVNLRRKIKEALSELQEAPDQKGERLHPSDYWKIRIGDYRAIYQIESKSVIIIFVGHRSKVYDNFERLL